MDYQSIYGAAIVNEYIKNLENEQFQRFIKSMLRQRQDKIMKNGRFLMQVDPEFTEIIKYSQVMAGISFNK